jgi:ATP-dependent helicase HepA
MVLEKGDVFGMLDRGAVKKKLLPTMLEKALSLAAERMQQLTAGAATAMSQQLQAEIDRLEDLREINSHVTPEEIAGVKQQRTELDAAIRSAHLRLGAVRLIARSQSLG